MQLRRKRFDRPDEVRTVEKARIVFEPGWRCTNSSLTPFRESDNLILVKILTATEASRNFASLLDEAERGGIIVVTRGGRRVATIGPAAAANGSAVLALLEMAEIDEEFASDVQAARESAIAEAPAWPEG